MNEKKMNRIIIISIISGIILMILGILLMFLTNIIYFIALSFVGAFFLIAFPVKLVKKNSYDIKDTLDSLHRNLMQDLCFKYLNDKSIILPLDEYETDSDIAIKVSRIGFIKHEFTNKPNEAIYIDMNKNKFVVKHKKIKETRLFQNYKTVNDVILEIRKIINNF